MFIFMHMRTTVSILRKIRYFFVCPAVLSFFYPASDNFVRSSRDHVVFAADQQRSHRQRGNTAVGTGLQEKNTKGGGGTQSNREKHTHTHKLNKKRRKAGNDKERKDEQVKI